MILGKIEAYPYRLTIMTKTHYCFALLLPPLFYYVALDVWPQTMAALWLGWPLSVLLGLLVMAWSALVGLWFAHRAVPVSSRGEGEHE